MIVRAINQFREEVVGGQFPTEEHSYQIKDQELESLIAEMTDLLGR